MYSLFKKLMQLTKEEIKVLQAIVDNQIIEEKAAMKARGISDAEIAHIIEEADAEIKAFIQEFEVNNQQQK